MTFTPPPRHRLPDVTITPFSDQCVGMALATSSTPASGTWSVGNLARFFPLYLLEPATVLKAFIVNGATVGTDSWDIGVYQMTNLTTGRLDLIRSTGAVLSAGSANVVQASAAWKIATTGSASLTSGSSSTDATSYTTASVTLKAGRLYLMSVENSKAVLADVVSSIDNGPTFVSRSAVTYSATTNYTSIWSAVPTVDYTGTLVINFGANTETGCCWSLDEFSGVDTTTNHGIVQQATATGNSGTASVTLSAFGSTNNATFAAHGHAAATATAPKAGFTETSDKTAATPAQALETEWNVANDTTPNATFSSAAWGSCAVELKADASAFVIPGSSPGNPNIYLAMTISGTTATPFRGTASIFNTRMAGILELSSFPLQSNLTPTAATSGTRVPLAGISLRTLLD